ncbi:MAG: hypothetical protein WCS31_13160 [Verrucomicrobiae bacterium]
MKSNRLAAALMITPILAIAASITETRDLTASGGIPLWVYVDKVPFPNGSEDTRKTLEQEVLPGEASLAPVAGQIFQRDHREYPWRAVSLTDGYFSLVADEDKGGKPLDFSSGYAYCVIHSPEARKADLVIGSDDSFRVYLNGKLAGTGFYERGVSSRTLEDTVPLDLKKGDNALLVRVDNYRNDMGLYCKVVSKEGEPLTDLKASITRDAGSPLWVYPNTLDNHYAYVRTPPPLPEANEELFGSRIQRTMTLLQTSTSAHRNKVKILFYGQSITAGDWYAIIEKNLRERFPNADLEVKNLSIGGHTAPTLVRCAAQDVYPYYPDLVIFNVYGGTATGELERIFYNIRKLTTAEVLVFSHHIALGDQDIQPHDEESESYKALAQKYNFEFVNLREQWQRYLDHYRLQRSDLLSDAVHPNRPGAKLMAELVLKHLQFNTLFPGGWYDQVKTYEARRFFEERGDEMKFDGTSWKPKEFGVVGGKAGEAIKLPFRGNRVDVVVPSQFKGKLGTAKILIDGQAPSAFPGIYAATRSSIDIIKLRPAIKRVTLGENAIAEDWTLRITGVSDDCRDFDYEVIGSVTGPDGKGSRKEAFVSKSGRIRLAGNDLHPFYNLQKKRGDMIGFEVKWSVVAHGLDTWNPAENKDPSIENACTLAQGLPNTEHTLEILPNGDGDLAIKAVRVYSPPLK